MKVYNTEIEDLKIIEPERLGDDRGWFSEVYSLECYREFGINAEFVQDNESFSSRGVVRGLHWQAAPHTQAKLVRAARGSVWDVAVDIRKGSKTYGKHVAVELSAENGRQLFIPRGFAHGFVVLEDKTLFSYKCDNYYCAAADRGIRFDDPALGIQWPKMDIPLNLSERDLKHPFFCDIEPWED